MLYLLEMQARAAPRSVAAAPDQTRLCQPGGLRSMVRVAPGGVPVAVAVAVGVTVVVGVGVGEGVGVGAGPVAQGWNTTAPFTSSGAAHSTLTSSSLKMRLAMSVRFVLPHQLEVDF